MVSGIEALVLGMIDQAKADRRDGHPNAGFVSRYRDSACGVDLKDESFLRKVFV
jgi:hypothetical protein